MPCLSLLQKPLSYDDLHRLLHQQHKRQLGERRFVAISELPVGCAARRCVRQRRASVTDSVDDQGLTLPMRRRSP